MTRLDDFSPYIEAAMQSWHCPGAAVVVLRGDEVLYQAAFGLRDVEADAAMTLDTRFAMASVTKSFAAMCIALLVDDGLIEWDKPVREYMPEFILADPYITANITVRDMLSHRTGLPRHDLAAWRMDLSLAEFIKRMRHLRFSATFREKFQYNNLMYYASSYLVERVSGMTWDAFMRARIFAPLGMTASNFAPEPPAPGQITAKGYRVDRDEVGGAKGLIPMPYGQHTALTPGAAGALFSTAADLTAWLRVHLNGGALGDFRLISPSNLQQMHLPHTVIPAGGIQQALLGGTVFTYGLGWFVEPYRGHTLVHHGGNVEGFSLIIGFVPEAGVGIIGLTNIAGLPLRDIILYEGVDRALGLEPRDWNARYHGLFDPILAATAAGKQTSAEEKRADAPPTHPLDTYVGQFAADGYPDFAVRCLDDGGLEACTVGSLDWSPLRHYHYNVFEWHLPSFDFSMKLTFQVSHTGEVDAVLLAIEPSLDAVTFRRKPLALPVEVLAALVGEYATPVPGLSFIASARDGKLYIIDTETTAGAKEARPYRHEAHLVAVDVEGMRFEFALADGACRTLTFKGEQNTLVATRVGVSALA